MKLFLQLEPIERGINFFTRRVEVIQSNIANVDTPNYRPKDLIFEEVLEEEIRLKKTNPRHMDVSSSNSYMREITLEDISGYDGNRVNLDKELAKLAESALMARSLNEVLKKEIGKLKLAIGGR